MTTNSTPVVAVLGAVNMDLVVSVPHLPVAGETVLGGDLVRYHGGKGGNQAVAAARAGAAVRMIGAVGDDSDGAVMREGLAAEGIDVDHLQTLPGPSGHALICVGPDGDNQIVVAPGANSRLAPAAVAAAVAGASALLVSLEVPTSVVEAAVLAAHRNQARIVLNAAPAQHLPPVVLACHPILVVNEDELRQLIEGMDDPADRLLAQGSHAMVVTRGAQGVSWTTGAAWHDVPAYHAGVVVDATGAGDGFCGALVAWLAAGEELSAAVGAANVAAGLSVQSPGARTGMPRRQEIVRSLPQSGA